MTRKTKSDWKEIQREKQEKTEGELHESEDILHDGSEAVDDWGEQPEPSLAETADALNVIAEELGKHIGETHETQAEKADDAVEEQVREVSEPAREDEGTEREATEHLAASARREGGRFGEHLVQASEDRKEAEEFLKETAEKDEEHQENSKQALAEHRRELESAVARIENF